MKSPKRLVLAIGTSQTLAYGTTSYLPAILAPSMGLSLGLSVSTIFLGLTAALITAACVGPWAGKWVDTGRGRDVLLAAHIVYMLGLFCLGASTGILTLLGSWILLGIGMSLGQYEAAFSVLTSYYGQEARAPITGITLIAGFASTICWPLSTLMDQTIGWRNACGIWGLCHLLIAIPLIFAILPKKPRINHSHDHEPGKKAGAQAPGSISWILVVLGFLFFVTWFTTGAMGSHLPLILSGMGLTKEQAVGIAALMGPMQVVARFSESLFLKKFHPLTGARIASFCHPLGAVLLLIFGPVMAPVFTMLHGAGNGILTIAKGTLPLALFGPKGYGLRQGLLMIPARIGMAAAPFTFGLAVETWGSHAVVLTGSLTLIAGLSLFTIKPKPSV
ncbi:MAG: MFS transporter [Kiritimatiellia bacterium]